MQTSYLRQASHTPGPISFRAATGRGGKASIAGYAVKFNHRSQNQGTDDEPLFEVIEPGFFDNVLGDDVRCLFNHEPNMIFGRTSSGTLRLTQNATGLFYECEADMGQYHTRNLVASLRRGDITESSFWFEYDKKSYRIAYEGLYPVLYYIRGGCRRLIDVSPVTEAAFPTSTSFVRKEPHEGRIGRGDIWVNSLALRRLELDALEC